MTESSPRTRQEGRPRPDRAGAWPLTFALEPRQPIKALKQELTQADRSCQKITCGRQAGRENNTRRPDRSLAERRRAAQTGASQNGAGQQRRQDSEPAGSGGRDRDRQQTPGFPRGRAALGKRTLSQAGRARLRGSRPSPRLQASSSLDPSPSFPEKSQGSLFGFWFLNFITSAVALRL